MSAEPSSSPTPGPAPSRRRTAWGHELAAFCAIALLVLLAVSAGTVWLRTRLITGAVGAAWQSGDVTGSW
jgi:hypothetical protein